MTWCNLAGDIAQDVWEHSHVPARRRVGGIVKHDAETFDRVYRHAKADVPVVGRCAVCFAPAQLYVGNGVHLCPQHEQRPTPVDCTRHERWL